MTKYIIPALTLVALFTISLGLYLTDPISQAHRQNMNSLKYHQAESLVSSINIFIVLLVFVLLVAVAVALFVLLRALHVRFVSPYGLAEHRNYIAYLTALKNEFLGQQPSFEGVQTVHWSPRDNHALTLTSHQKAAATKPSFEQLHQLDEEPLIEQVVPTFQKALADSTQAAFVFGYDEMGKPYHGTLDNLTTGGVGGGMGSGKTSTATFFLAMAVRSGARLIVIDGHAGNTDSLANRLAPLSPFFMCAVASTSEQIESTITYINNLVDTRKQNPEEKYERIIVVIDEWLSLMSGDLKQPLHGLAEMLSQETRKFGITGYFIAHKWTTKKSGDMVHTLTSHTLCRTQPRLASYQTGMRVSDLPRDLLKLPKGQIYFLDNFGELNHLYIPYVSKEDLEYLVYDLQNHVQSTTDTFVSDYPTISMGNTLGVVKEDTGNSTTTQPTTFTPLSADHARIVEMFTNKMTVAQITRELSGVKAGRKYTDTQDEVNAALLSVIEQFPHLLKLGTTTD